MASAEPSTYEKEILVEVQCGTSYKELAIMINQVALPENEREHLMRYAARLTL